jgi:hypothetical protein
MRVEGTLFESFEEQEVKNLSNNITLVLGKYVLVLLSQ